MCGQPAPEQQLPARFIAVCHPGSDVVRDHVLGIPTAIRQEHEEIHARLALATKLAGRTGEAARALAEVLHPHFVREEQIALPPLGLLAGLAKGEPVAGMLEVLPMVDALRAELPHMIEEHRAITAATRRLAGAAELEGQAAAAQLAAELLAHAGMEEQVMYPAAVLVGELVRLRAASASG